MELVNEIQRHPDDPAARFATETAVSLIQPYAPHVAEELWGVSRARGRLWERPWPEADPALLVDDEVEIVVQVNGKVRDRLRVAATIGRRRAARPGARLGARAGARRRQGAAKDGRRPGQARVARRLSRRVATARRASRSCIDRAPGPGRSSLAGSAATVDGTVETSAQIRHRAGIMPYTPLLPSIEDMIFERLPRRQTAILLVVCVVVLALVGRRLAAAGTARAPAAQAVVAAPRIVRPGGAASGSAARRLRRRRGPARGPRAAARGRSGRRCARARRWPEPPGRPHARQPRGAGGRRTADRRSGACPGRAAGGAGATRAAPAKVSLASATLEQLDALPGNRAGHRAEDPRLARRRTGRCGRSTTSTRFPASARPGSSSSATW